MSWESTYYQRVQPAIGEVFRNARVFCWGLDEAATSARALAQSGIRRQVWFDDDGALAPWSRLEHPSHRWSRGRAEALEDALRGHNQFEAGWQLERRPRCIDELRDAVAAEAPGLLLGALDERAEKVLEVAMEAGVPTILSGHLAAAPFSTLQVVWHPDSTVDVDSLRTFVSRAAASPRLDESDPAAHLEALEGRSLTLSLARWLLAPGRPERPDLVAPLLDEGRAVVLRGDATWPWALRFARPSVRLAELALRPTPRYRAPSAFVGSETILVLGLGTASLFCAQAPLLAKHLVLLDCKEVSPFNPVRQLYPTSRIGEPKAPALAAMLAERLAPGTWDRSEDRGLSSLRCGDRTISSGELFLSRRQRGSLDRFREILDATRPSLAIVAMGRSKDDNFLATAELRRRGIRHITPTAFPGVSHFKHILTDGGDGPCYDCLQGHLAIDGGAGPTLQPQERELFYGGTQPATLAETLPSATSLLRLSLDLALPPAARPSYLRGALASERNCLVGANRVEPVEGGWLYGVDAPFSMVTYGVEDLLGSRANEHCPCGRVNPVRVVDGVL